MELTDKQIAEIREEVRSTEYLRLNHIDLDTAKALLAHIEARDKIIEGLKNKNEKMFQVIESLNLWDDEGSVTERFQPKTGGGDE